MIVAWADNVTIYDGDDPALPMWAIWNSNYTATNAGFGFNTSIAMLNGLLVFGKNQSANFTGIVEIDLVADVGRCRRWSNYNNQQLLAPTARSLTPEWYVGSLPGLASALVNDVAMTVLPGSPIDPNTGLPVPTIVVATNGGVSVIKDDGGIYDITFSGGWGSNISNVSIAGADLYFQQTIYYWLKVPLASVSQDYVIASYGFSANPPFVKMQPLTNSFGNSCGVAAENSVFELAYPLGSASGSGMLLLGGNNSSMSYRLHRDYISGWIIGAARGSFLGDKNDADLVGDGSLTTPTRAGGGALLVVGTITRVHVAMGAELIAYSGFSEVNYLEGTHETYADMLYALGWVQPAGVWEFKNGVVSAAPIDGLTITGTTLKIAGTKPKALVRVTATTPTTAQLVKIEADERFLFQENAACTLYGASDAVTALAHDPDTGHLHVGTSAGRSVFQGLRRVANTTVPVTTAVAAAGGMVVDE